jgi:hypothetical protein
MATRIGFERSIFNEIHHHDALDWVEVMKSRRASAFWTTAVSLSEKNGPIGGSERATFARRTMANNLRISHASLVQCSYCMPYG